MGNGLTIVPSEKDLTKMVEVFYMGADAEKGPGRTYNWEAGVLALLEWCRGYRPTKEQRCHDCGCAEGEYHRWGCDSEVCPHCFGQLISCDCRYERMGYDPQSLKACYPDIYENGLPKEKAASFDAGVRREGRLRYVAWPTLCAYCGRHMGCAAGGTAADLHWAVPDEEWKRNVPRSHWKKVLCRGCYDHLASCVSEADVQKRREGAK